MDELPNGLEITKQKQMQQDEQKIKDETIDPLQLQVPAQEKTETKEVEKVKRKEIQETIPEVQLKAVTIKDYQDPDFQVLTPAQVSKLSKKKKKEYNSKLPAFNERAQQWVASETKRIEAENKRIALAARHREGVEMQQRVDLEGETWPTIEASPEMMDEALKQNAVDEVESRELSELELRAWFKRSPKNFIADMALQQYMQYTNVCNQMNSYMRFGGQGGYAQKLCEQAVEGMKDKQLSRDMVSRRGTTGYSALAGMLGLDAHLEPEAIRQELEKRVSDGKDVVLTEKGFCSTSLRSDAGYSCGEQGGIEFIILAKKGTSAIDYRVGGSRETEQELLIGPGTRFKLVKAFFGDRDSFLGNKSTWKVYLESIPQGDNNGETV